MNPGLFSQGETSKTPGRTQPKTPGRATGKTPGRTPENTSAKTPGRTPGNTSAKTPGRTPGKPKSPEDFALSNQGGKVMHYAGTPPGHPNYHPTAGIAPLAKTPKAPEEDMDTTASLFATGGGDNVNFFNAPATTANDNFGGFGSVGDNFGGFSGGFGSSR